MAFTEQRELYSGNWLGFFLVVQEFLLVTVEDWSAVKKNGSDFTSFAYT